MGYKLTSLVHLPLDDSVEMYVFCIGDQIWEGGLGEIVHRNFDNLARSIGPQAIIVGALEQEFHGEVVNCYLGRNCDELMNKMPAVLITDAHPKHLSDSSLRVLIPLKEAHEHYHTIDDFLSDLASFVKGESDQLLLMLESAPKPQEFPDDIVVVTLPVFPGIVAVNVNAAVGHLRVWWNSRKHRR